MTDELLWAVKTSLMSYIDAQESGSITVTGGATRLPDGRFSFPTAPDGPGADGWRFQGGVHLLAHGGLLDLELSEPWVQAAPWPTVSVVARVSGGEPERLTLATLSLARVDDAVWRGEEVRLTFDGALTLGGLQYHERQQIDDLLISDPSRAHPRDTAAPRRTSIPEATRS